MKFKTNINCSGCIAKVTPLLNEAVGEGAWQVDTNQPEKILTITNTGVTEQIVTEAVKKAGFKIESSN